MKQIPLTKGMVALVDDEDFELVSKYRWYASKSKNLHYVTTSFRKNKKRISIRLHRLILGISDPKTLVDHINGNPLDNQKHNLRLCSNGQNVQNRGILKTSSSGYKGVYFDNNRQRWAARIYFNGGQKYLGTFPNPEAAARAYDEAAKTYHGEFAKLNFP